MSNLDTAKSIYAAFGRGDIPFILSQIADDAVWEGWPGGNAAQQAGVLWMAERQGPHGVAEFFNVVGQMDFSRFDVISILDGGDRVAGLISFDMVYRPTGRRLVDEEMHLFEFDAAGKIKGFRHFLDTAKHIEAAGL